MGCRIMKGVTEQCMVRLRLTFRGLPEPPELEGIDEDRLRELQNAIQEQLCQRDEERERNITKRVQEF